MSLPRLRLVAMEITRTCPLSCKHCRGDSRNREYPDELTFDEIKKILDNIAAFSSPIIIITGGEPLTNHDVFDIARYSTSLGLRTVLATCGRFLNRDTVRRLIESGIRRISISIDGASAAAHDSFRGESGAFNAALKGIEAAQSQGLEFQINSTLTTLNIGELDELHTLSVNLGAVGFHPFLLVPIGRGQGLSDFALSPDAYESALKKIAELAARSPLEIKPTCSPHYSRVYRQARRGTSGVKPPIQTGPLPSVHHGHGSLMTRGCLGGQGFVFVSHVGKVQICGFLDLEAGDLRRNSYDFRKIWETSPLFLDVRAKEKYTGKCGSCEFWNVCGGCRARAFYLKGSYLEDEPNCIYIPCGLEKHPELD